MAKAACPSASAHWLWQRLHVVPKLLRLQPCCQAGKYLMTLSPSQHFASCYLHGNQDGDRTCAFFGRYSNMSATCAVARQRQTPVRVCRYP